MTVEFFSEPYLLYEDGYPTLADPTVMSIAEHRVGYHRSFPIYIVNCLHDYKKDWV